MGRGRAENLNPWPKGTSDNPNGRPPAPWREWLTEVEPDLRELFHTVVTDKRVKVATRVGVAEFLANHLHGQPKQPIEQEGGPTMLIVPEAIAARLQGAGVSLTAEPQDPASGKERSDLARPE